MRDKRLVKNETNQVLKLYKVKTYSVGIEIGGFLFVGGHTLRPGRRFFFPVRVDSLWGISQMFNYL